MKYIFIINHFFSVLMFLLSLETNSLASVPIKVDNDKRLSVPISFDSMNRIAFAHDRIAQVFGDDEAYTMQSDELKGQIFIKPTEDNGDKPIAITITTEQGTIQDMELIPQKIATQTLILKDDSRKMDGNQGKNTLNGFGVLPSAYRGSHTAFSYNPLTDANRAGCEDYANQMVQLIKFAVVQTYNQITGDDDLPASMTITHLHVDGVNVFKKNGLKVSVYKIVNTTDQTVEISENEFSDRNILAVSCEKQSVMPQETLFVYIVQQA